MFNKIRLSKELKNLNVVRTVSMTKPQLPQGIYV